MISVAFTVSVLPHVNVPPPYLTAGQYPMFCNFKCVSVHSVLKHCLHLLIILFCRCTTRQRNRQTVSLSNGLSKENHHLKSLQYVV